METKNTTYKNIKTIPKYGLGGFLEFRDRVQQELAPTKGEGHTVITRGGPITISSDPASLSAFLELAKEYQFSETGEYSIFNLFASKSALEKGEDVEWNIAGYQKANDLITMQEWLNMNKVISIETAAEQSELIQKTRAKEKNTLREGDQPDFGLQETGTNGV